MLQYICKPEVVLYSKVQRYFYIPLDTSVSNYKNLVVYFIITFLLRYTFYCILLDTFISDYQFPMISLVPEPN